MTKYEFNGLPMLRAHIIDALAADDDSDSTRCHERRAEDIGMIGLLGYKEGQSLHLTRNSHTTRTYAQPLAQ